MTVAFVVQRYGLDINGGAELHCRWVAEHMSRHLAVEVLTSCAHDYITWRNHYPEGEETIHGVPVRRFPVSKTRNPERFGRLQNRILQNEHREQDEIAWLDEEGPTSPKLIQFIRKNLAAMEAILEKISAIDDLEKKTALLFSDLKPQMEHIRRHVDAIESSVPDRLWSLPKYREMLFIK